MDERFGRGVVFALLAAVFFGVNTPFARMAFEHGIPAITSVLFRSATALAAFGAVSFALALPMRVPRALRPNIAVLALASGCLSAGYLSAVQFIPVGLAAIIFFTFPVIILLVAPLMEGHRVGIARIAVSLLAFSGLALAIGPSFGDLDWRGIALAMLASIAAVAQSFSGRSLARTIPETVFAFWVHMLVAPVMLAAALWLNGGTFGLAGPGPTPSAGHLALLVVGVAYVCAYFSLMRSLRHAQASSVAPFFNLEPVVSTLAAAVILGEALTANQYVGGGLVIAAIVIAGRIRQPGKARVTAGSTCTQGDI